MRNRLTERDLSRIVRRVVNEETSNIKQTVAEQYYNETFKSE